MHQRPTLLRELSLARRLLMYRSIPLPNGPCLLSISVVIIFIFWRNSQKAFQRCIPRRRFPWKKWYLYNTRSMNANRAAAKTNYSPQRPAALTTGDNSFIFFLRDSWKNSQWMGKGISKNTHGSFNVKWTLFLFFWILILVVRDT